ncbi:MAG: ferredoxin-thioredoxin reductase catalytic domain-containing protein [Halobacteriota archaeon]|nr:ferredoxin-thioredoxin reductase catalytic domain-containing protein [Halobacteriota archaeon]
MNDTRDDEVEGLYKELDSDAERSGYHLNPDLEFTKDLLSGLVTNEKRYGYRACPCRIASGSIEEDIDIICPCDYRDPDLNEYGMCYCALYVSESILKGENDVEPIPERRPSPDEREISMAKPKPVDISALSLPVWRCRVCGYLCAREDPPESCPICKAKKERFERFI